MDMDPKIEKYQILSKLFKQNGYQLYLVGGTVRDYLLNRELTDMDAVTDATPEEMKNFLMDADFTFAKYGSIKYHFLGLKFDITTLREEKGYLDSRHPEKIQFVKDLSSDVKRRDFTINGLYLNDKIEVIDFVGGSLDLSNHLLRCIGDADTRIKEDPLRIIRALRFAVDFDLTIEESLNTAISNNILLLNKINPEKIKEDIKKIKCQDKNKIKDIFDNFHITHLLNVLE